MLPRRRNYKVVLYMRSDERTWSETEVFQVRDRNAAWDAVFRNELLKRPNVNGVAVFDPA